MLPYLPSSPQSHFVSHNRNSRRTLARPPAYPSPPPSLHLGILTSPPSQQTTDRRITAPSSASSSLSLSLGAGSYLTRARNLKRPRDTYSVGVLLTKKFSYIPIPSPPTRLSLLLPGPCVVLLGQLQSRPIHPSTSRRSFFRPTSILCASASRPALRRRHSLFLPTRRRRLPALPCLSFAFVVSSSLSFSFPPFSRPHPLRLPSPVPALIHLRTPQKTSLPSILPHHPQFQNTLQFQK